MGAVSEGGHALGNCLQIGLHLEVEVELLAHALAELDHLAELPGGVDMHDLEGNRCGRERLAREVQEDRGVLADRIEQDGPTEGTGDLAIDVDSLGLKGIEDVVFRHRRVGSGGHDHLPGSPAGLRDMMPSTLPAEGATDETDSGLAHDVDHRAGLGLALSPATGNGFLGTLDDGRVQGRTLDLAQRLAGPDVFA